MDTVKRKKHILESRKREVKSLPSAFYFLLSISNFSLFTFSNSFAQQKPQYTQYIINPYLINPALTGIENYIDIKAGRRYQWQGLENAPKTDYFTAHLPIGNTMDWHSPISFDMVGENPLGRSYKSEYMAAEPHHGVGIVVVSDKAGPLKNTTANVTYAYHLGLAPKLNLSVGIGVGATQTSFDVTDVKLGEENDPAVQAASSSIINPDLNFGVWLYSVDYFAGVSVQQLLPRAISFSNSSSQKSSHYFVTTGYRFWFSDDVTFTPSVMLRYVNPAPTSLDLNAKFSFKNKVWAGVGYRQDDAVSGMLGFNLGSLLNVGYAYDFTTSQLNSVTQGSHEIVLGITLNNHYRLSNPRLF